MLGSAISTRRRAALPAEQLRKAGLQGSKANVKLNSVTRLQQSHACHVDRPEIAMSRCDASMPFHPRAMLVTQVF